MISNKEKIFTALGEASMCWNPQPSSQVFDSERASEIGERLHDDLFGDTNKISDGYHTFGELYEHRITLFIALCRVTKNCFTHGITAFRLPVKDGWFVLGLYPQQLEQITYHLPESRWSETDFATTLQEEDFVFDGHTSADVLERLKQL